MKVISKTKKINIRECYVNCGDSVRVNYQVEWEVTTVYENIWGNIKSKVETKKDLLAFPTIELAVKYAENVEAPSVPLDAFYDCGSYYHSAVIYPIGFNALRKKILKTSITSDSYEEFMKAFHLTTSDTANARELMTLWINGKRMYDYKYDLSKVMESDAVKAMLVRYKMNGNCNGAIVKTVETSPVGLYESGVTGETNEYKKSRDEIIDSELERCRHYMAFLETMKK